MKLLKKISIALAALLVAAVPFSIIGIKANKAEAASGLLLGTPTGYTQASDVQYKKSGKTIINWGAREEDCIFLSTEALSFYTGSYTYEALSANSGGSSQTNAPSSALYKSLQTLMTSKHSHQTSYGETRYEYCYTDCVNSNSNYISSFYSATKLGGEWGSSPTWNREHTWPKSKSLNGKDEGGADEADLIMLRPTATSENSSRGNTAYGESYYNPNSEGDGNVDLRGDCARICLYVYVRWGNTNYMWGSSGVMENLSVLLKWMEEDPVDTWEMGRNDSVQSITGTRNVFVDYPEFAWLLFGQTAPDDMPTPSGKASNGEVIGNAGSGSGGNSSTPDSDTGSEDVDTPTYNTPAEILNALYGLSDGQTINGSFTLTGKITSLDSYNNPTFVVDGFEDKPVYCYKLVLNNAKLGDIITVSADTLKNHQGTYEFMNCTLISSESGGGSGDSSSGDSSSSDSGNSGGSDVVGNVLATFTFGENKGSAHVDGNDLGTSKSYTENGYTLSLTNMTKVFGPAYDAKGNSCIKLGAKVVGGFTFTVGGDVKQIIIYAAKYKAEASELSINSKTYTLTKASNDGQYDVIIVDTTTTKTIEVQTTSSGKRAMISTIEFLSAEDDDDTTTDSDTDSSTGDTDTCEHIFGGWTVDVEPTETTDGAQHRTCRLCEFVEEATIPALGNSSSDTGSSNEGSSDEPDVCEHNFNDWLTTKEPTETTDGKAIRTCLICGDKEEKILPATGSTSSDSSGDSSSDTSSESNTDSSLDSSNTNSSAGDSSSNSSTDDVVSSDSDTAPIGESGCSGCGSSITIGTSIISLAVLVGCGLVCKKRKEE